MIPATPDIWKIRPEAKLKYDEKFYQLKPVNGYIAGTKLFSFQFCISIIGEKKSFKIMLILLIFV